MKKDVMDMMLTKYETKLNEVTEYFNVPTLEDLGIAKQYYNMVKDELKTLEYFVGELYSEVRKAGQLKQRHIKQYQQIRITERTFHTSLESHGVITSRWAV